MNQIMKYYATAFILITALCLTACGMEMSRSRMKQIAEDALEKRHGEPFVVTDVLKNLDRRNGFDAYAYAESHPDVLVYARIEDKGDYVADNYLPKLMGMRIANVVRKNIGDIGGDYFIYVSSISEDMGLNDTSISIDDYVTYVSENQFTISVFYTPDGDIDAGSLYNKLKGASLNGLEKMKGAMVLRIMNKQDFEGIREYIETHARYEQDEYNQYYNGPMIRMYYENGIINTDYDSFVSTLLNE